MSEPRASPAFRVGVIVLAVIGTLTVVGAAGMALMHTSLMSGWGC